MNKETVILLYEGDAWLSRDSLYLRGIFTSGEDLRDYTQDMVAKGVIDEDGQEQLLNGWKQTSGIGKWSECCFMVEPSEVNPKEYDG